MKKVDSIQKPNELEIALKRFREAMNRVLDRMIERNQKFLGKVKCVGIHLDGEEWIDINEAVGPFEGDYYCEEHHYKYTR